MAKCKSNGIMKVKGVSLYRGGGHSGCPSRKKLENGKHSAAIDGDGQNRNRNRNRTGQD